MLNNFHILYICMYICVILYEVAYGVFIFCHMDIVLSVSTSAVLHKVAQLYDASMLLPHVCSQCTHI